MITNDNVQKFTDDYKFILTPVIKSDDPNKDKKPKAEFLGNYVNGKPKFEWRYDWAFHELLAAQRLGAFHKESGILDVDFDDKNYIAHKFIDCLPPTFTVGKKVNGKVIATHKIYYRKNKDVKVKNYSYPKSASKGGKIIEILANTQTIIAGVDRVIVNDVMPMVIDPSALELETRLIVAFSELYTLVKDNQNRNDFYFKLGGALARETDVPMDLRIKYVKKLCELTNDDEVNNRVDCIERQQENFENKPDEVFGIQELSKFLGANLPAFDEIKKEEEDAAEEEEIDFNRTIAFNDLNSFLTTDFPQPSYIIEPLVSDQSIVQIVGASGVGKTMFGLAIAGAISTANGLLGMASVGGARPILYVEGELPASDIQIRVNGMFNAIERKCDPNMFYVSSLQQQLKVNDKGFTPIQTEQGLIEIENAIVEIKKRTGKMPVVFIDNISCLASGLKENDADAWSPIINKFVKWKNMGSTVFYFHHLNKGNDSSGSTMQHRTIDMVIRMRKPDNKQKIKTFEDKGVQAIVDFPKWRLHDNSKYAAEHMLICEDWKWQKLPVLTSDEADIIKMVNEGLDVKEMSEKVSLAEKTIYKKIKKLKDEGVITDDKASRQTANSDAEDIC
ncbi:MAG: AAA family ATPase [Pelagibacterales bacterium]|nr:AAA family ATPase [Pelagibacterales bacterium]